MRRSCVEKDPYNPAGILSHLGAPTRPERRGELRVKVDTLPMLCGRLQWDGAERVGG